MEAPVAPAKAEGEAEGAVVAPVKAEGEPSPLPAKPIASFSSIKTTTTNAPQTSATSSTLSGAASAAYPRAQDVRKPLDEARYERQQDFSQRGYETRFKFLPYETRLPSLTSACPLNLSGA